jgi:hypothetical protein
MIFSGTPVRGERGALIEYTQAPNRLMLAFEFNPSTISRTRAVTVRTGGSPGSRGGYDFQEPREVPRASQGVSVQAETFSFKILLDATDRMGAGDPLAHAVGVEPEIDVLRSMVEPKAQTQQGAQTLAALGAGSPRAFSRHEFSSVLLFVWGTHLLPVFLTQVQVEGKDYLPNLAPYRAEATLSLQVIESRNPFYEKELQRQFGSAQAFSIVGMAQLGLNL